MTVRILFILVIFSASLFAQKEELTLADKKYEENAYIDAAQIYLKVAESGLKSEELYRKLANSYYFNANYKEAVKWYKALEKMNADMEPMYFLRYSQSLKALEKAGSEEMYAKFLESKGNLSGDEYASVDDYRNILEESPERYTVKKTNVNSDKVDFGGFFLRDTLYFASNRERRMPIARTDKWGNQPFLDIYYAVFSKEQGNFSKPQLLQGDVNTKYHETSAVITKDGNTMYFTKSNTTPSRKIEKDQKTHLKIYRATKVEGKWKNIEDLPINGDTYSTAHPALSPDEKTLYYVSNMPGTTGQTDLFSVSIYRDGKLGKPKNLGSKINTKGRESFPFVTKDNELYFSSDGHFGLGGYDVFYFDLHSKAKQLVNLGTPINSSKDDYAFTIDTRTRKGFYSSNRDGEDEIYSFVETKPIKEMLEMRVEGIVTDKETKEPLANTLLTITSQDRDFVTTLRTDERGKFATRVNKFDSYILKAEKKDYDPDDIFIFKKKKSVYLPVELRRNRYKIQRGLDIAKILNIVIYFDFDKATIRDDAKVELEKLLAVLKKYPKIKVDLNSYTDSRGDDAYNRTLSEKRARSTKDYLVTRGIDPSRLNARGYGESKPVNKCSNGVPCTEKEHQLNRRTAFIVVEK